MAKRIKIDKRLTLFLISLISIILIINFVIGFVINLNSPTDDSIVTTNLVNFNCTTSSSNYVANVSLFTNYTTWGVNSTFNITKINLTGATFDWVGWSNSSAGDTPGGVEFYASTDTLNMWANSDVGFGGTSYAWVFSNRTLNGSGTVKVFIKNIASQQEASSDKHIRLTSLGNKFIQVAIPNTLASTYIDDGVNNVDFGVDPAWLTTGVWLKIRTLSNGSYSLEWSIDGDYNYTKLSSGVINPVGAYNPTVEIYAAKSSTFYAHIQGKISDFLVYTPELETRYGGNTTEMIVKNSYPSGSLIDWNCYVCLINGTCAFSGTNFTFSIDSITPTISVAYPSGIISNAYLGQNVSLNYTISDSNLDDCWYSYMGINKTLNCTTNTTIILNTSKNLIMYANDTAGNLKTYSHNWSYSMFQNSINYNEITTEGSTETFTLNISTSVPISSVYLVYNGTSYLATTISDGGGNSIATRSLTMPTVNSTTNNTLFWNVSLTGTPLTYYASTTKTQEIRNIQIYNCSSGSILYNFTLRDEATRTILNGTLNSTLVEIEISLSPEGAYNPLETFAQTFNAVNPITICLNNSLNSSRMRMDVTASYIASGFVQEFYFADNITLTNNSMNNQVDFYDLKSADSTTFLFSFTGSNGLEVEDAIVHVFRKYIGDGLFREVERARDDENGETHVHLVEEDVIYYFQVTQYGNLIYTSSEYNAKCLSTPCSLTLSASQGIADSTDIVNTGEAYNMVVNKTSRMVTLSFGLNESALINLTIYQYNNNNLLLINSSSVEAVTGSIALHIPVSSGNSTYVAKIYRDNVFVKNMFFELKSTAKDIFGTGGAILGMLIVLTITLMAVTEGALLLIWIPFAIILLVIMGLVDMSWMAISLIIVIGMIIVWKLIRRNRV